MQQARKKRVKEPIEQIIMIAINMVKAKTQKI